MFEVNMPLDVRKVAVNLSVIFFFSLSIVTLISGLSPFMCCKRAITGAVVVYFVATIALKIINMILIDAMMTKQIEQNKNSEIIQKK
jgi:predicted cation transporter